MARKKGLGKGLEALFEDNNTAVSASGVELIKISEIEPNKNQPRRDFDQTALEQLADSIREHGIIQPLVLRPLTAGGYQIVAGERRYRASRMAGLNEVPAVIKELTDTETMEIALIENLQREDLNPVEEALGYQELMEKYDFTQDAVSKSVGKSRPAIANSLRLLNLPEEVLDMVRDGSLSSGHARAILSLEEPEQMVSLAKRVADEGLNVRAVEKLVKKSSEKQKEEKPADFVAKDKYFSEMQLALTTALGRKIAIEKGRKKSKLVIEFYDETDLKEIAQKLTGENQ
ncbi:Probable chromosome-partitioning protein parB [uncultured Ruminococcus sp.]|uniref:ParB/RepB/Spo0J family partition protein n=1 Tax=Massiliimalia timonensis TaxID=1987501 RepID=A0A8J6PEV9_9FIRM|nr:ParB/RepB/Spo0J family partition protein [Massiliimalia timonensis]MBC8610906.1 ParB/RepB/Spo0J family partition protein [Massiliimalia timonensis]MBS7174743.1 ParB/RepB/Spo0J family partition protein [Clostridiales bacterium]SCI02843.1 Probable chromosome-partitioning protein parB [uncultured Clostridium sp.]SCI15277.1 Probable chromosome-partitioning protein parB [uncultured Ruminococcus sp.]